ncbi:hypothetical protein RVIR1_05080 [Candidatus Rickettsiella viridis]|uniref:Uncharacterized protein n=1 Tax=Candidatus Rickettsiella viridis TaxID=676208 RepID=A0A2Z5UVM2_9COXI|nr:hypothetical protein [Candidatus Rickettsiella viridis]BBB15013.1 hypothetical protein RVIR1_05080 [Candidatus Rickettsiella viridis]
MHKNKNYLTKKIAKNWNNVVLPTEEIILTRTPEEIYNKKIIKPLLDTYIKNIKQNINLYKENKELKIILNERITCIENFVKLKKILANKPYAHKQDKNNPFFDKEKNSLIQLIKELIKHNHYIQTNKIRLAIYQIPEDHIQPLIFNILAEAFNHLATLDWNSMALNPTDPNPEEFYPTCLSVLNAYETSLRYLKAERECLSNVDMRILCDEKILNTLDNIGATIYESFKTYNVLLSMNPLLKKEKELNTIENKSDIPPKQPPVTRKKRLVKDIVQTNRDCGFFKCKKSKRLPIKQATKRQTNQCP